MGFSLFFAGPVFFFCKKNGTLTLLLGLLPWHIQGYPLGLGYSAKWAGRIRSVWGSSVFFFFLAKRGCLAGFV